MRIGGLEDTVIRLEERFSECKTLIDCRPRIQVARELTDKATELNRRRERFTRTTRHLGIYFKEYIEGLRSCSQDQQLQPVLQQIEAELRNPHLFKLNGSANVNESIMMWLTNVDQSTEQRLSMEVARLEQHYQQTIGGVYVRVVGIIPYNLMINNS